MGRTLPRERKGIGHGSSACRFTAVTTRDRGLDGRGLDRSAGLGRLTLPVARRRHGRPDLLGQRGAAQSESANLADGSAAPPILVRPGGTPCGVAIDPAAGTDGKIYWAGSVSMRSTSGTSMARTSTTCITGEDNPCGVAIDPAAQQDLLGQLRHDAIRIANLDGSTTQSRPCSTPCPVGRPERGCDRPGAQQDLLDQPGSRRPQRRGRESRTWHGGDTQAIVYQPSQSDRGGHRRRGPAASTGPTSVRAAAGPVRSGAREPRRLHRSRDQPTDPVHCRGRPGWGRDRPRGQQDLLGQLRRWHDLEREPGRPEPAPRPCSAARGAPRTSPCCCARRSGTAAPAISEAGDDLSCSQGEWASDLLGAFLYRAPNDLRVSVAAGRERDPRRNRIRPSRPPGPVPTPAR